MNGKSLIKTGIGVGVGIALLAGVACGQGEYKTPTLSNNTTTTISRPSIDKKFSLEEVLTLAKIQPDFVEGQTIEKYAPYRVQQLFTNQLNDYLKQNQPLYGIPTSVSSRMHTPIRYLSFLESPEQYTNLVQKAEDALSHGLNYWKHDELYTPKVNIILPTTADQIHKEQPVDNINIYAVKAAGTIYPYRVSAKYPDGGILSIDLVANATSLGEAPGTININIKDGKMDVLQTTERLLWTIDEEDPLTYTTPAIEVLHTQLSALTLVHIIGTVHQNPDIHEEQLNNYKESFKMLEELMVHGGIGLNWKYQLNQDWNLGLTKQQIIGSNGWTKNYPQEILETTNHVHQIGVTSAIDKYKTDIKGLFEGIVTFVNN